MVSRCVLSNVTSFPSSNFPSHFLTKNETNQPRNRIAIRLSGIQPVTNRQNHTGNAQRI
ncbi:hypothetical protein Mal65_43010 [Crateriforma conspicua]|nr:hypothetical protein Mal65_43010 [Crateriforma conspicua]